MCLTVTYAAEDCFGVHPISLSSMMASKKRYSRSVTTFMFITGYDISASNQLSVFDLKNMEINL